MNRIIKYIRLFIVLFIVFVSCDKIEEPFAVEEGPAVTNRKILLEEFTGHTCPNCPEGAKIANNLKNIYGDRLVVVAIHAGYFAKPEQGLFSRDFRTTAGSEINDEFGVNNYPSAMVNRKDYEGDVVLSTGEWVAAVNDLIKYVEHAQVHIDNDYDPETRKLDINIRTRFLFDLEGTFSICTYITEDSIIAPQKNKDPLIGPAPIDTFYVHKHVLREAVNGTWGKQINNGEEIYSEQDYNNVFSTVIDTSWNETRCNIVSFVYQDDTREVIQAEEKRIVE